MKKGILSISLLAFCSWAFFPAYGAEDFGIKAFSPNEFYVFVKVFSEMRGPLRSAILKDKKTDFKDADPLKYVEKVRGEKDVKKALSENNLTWEKFRDLMGNVLLGYYSIQQDKTKAAMLKQLASYGLIMEMGEIPEEYRPMINEVLQTDAGATLASAALEAIIEIPSGNIEIVRKNRKDLDRMFYTKYWIDQLK